PHGVGSSHRASGVAAGGLNPEFFEQTRLKYLTVGHTVERNAARQYKISAPCQLFGSSRKPKNDLFRDHLDAQRHIHVNLRNLSLRLSPWDAKELLPFLLMNHLQTRGKIEPVHVEHDRTVFANIDKLGRDPLFEISRARRPWIAIRCEAHKFV